MKGFIIDPTYKVVNDKAYVFLFGRLSNGESFVTINPYKPYFYIKKKDLSKVKKLNFKKCGFKNFNGDEVVKIIVDVPAKVEPLRKSLSQKEIDYYESDIRLPSRFLMDKQINSCIDIDGDYESNDYIDRVYKNPDIKPCEFFPKLKLLSLDIEMNLDGNEILCISIYTDNYKKVFIRSKKKLKNAVNCDDECDMLEKFREKLVELDPDVITGWNFIDFDLVVLKERFKEHRIPFVLGRDNSNTRLRIQQNFLRTSTAEVAGRAVIDGMGLLRGSFVKLDDYKLETASQKILGYGKLLTGPDRGYDIQEYFDKKPQKLVDYNLQDAKLVYEILKKSKVWELTIKRSLITGLPMHRVRGSIAAFDHLYITEARKRKLVCPAARFVSGEAKKLGGYVKDPVPGIYENLIVMDFKSLYPSVIRSFNIDPYSFVPNCKGKNLVKAPNGSCFRNEEGILPVLIERIWKQRDIARKKKDELTRYALKIQLNTMYGVMASPSCRFYNTKVSNAITHFSQFIVKLTDKVIEKKGYKLLYNDTDSFFVQTNSKSLKQAEKIGKELEKEINNYYKKYVKKEYKRKSYLEMEYEKCYSSFLMPKLRGKEKGAKKRYAGLVNGKLEIVGLEAIRGDWTDAAQEFQEKLLDKVFHKKEVRSFVKKYVENIQKGKYDKKLVYRKQIRKDLSEYKVNPPHVKAARKLKVLNSNLIEYVITTDGPEPVQNIKHRLDYDHYISKQIKPIADSVLVFFDTNLEKLSKKNDNQVTLFKFS